MKPPKKVKSLSSAGADFLTPGDRRGIAAATKRAAKLKEKYAAGEPSAHILPDHISIMAGPVRKR